MQFDSLPIEVLQQIFNHLSAEDLWCNLRAVNRGFNQLIRQRHYWLKRTGQRHDGFVLPNRLNNEEEELPIVDVPDFAESRESVKVLDRLTPIYRCIATEWAFERWRDSRNGLGNSLRKTEAHFGDINAVRLFAASGKVFCLTGARDRQITLWDLSTVRNCASDCWKHVTIDKAHDGWVWSISSINGDAFFSAGWDSAVNKWQIAEAEIRNVHKISTDAPALCCVAENEHILYASTYRTGPILFDTRVCGNRPMASQNCHGQKPVYELATEEGCNQIFSIGDDNRLISVDKRCFEKVANNYQAGKAISHMDYSDSQLCICIRNGQLLFFNPQTLFKENEITITGSGELPSAGHYNIRVSRAATFCSSRDGTLRLFSSGLNPKEIASTKLDGAIIRMDVLGGHLIAALNSETLHYWPEESVMEF